MKFHELNFEFWNLASWWIDFCVIITQQHDCVLSDTSLKLLKVYSRQFILWSGSPLIQCVLTQIQYITTLIDVVTLIDHQSCLAWLYECNIVFFCPFLSVFFQFVLLSSLVTFFKVTSHLYLTFITWSCSFQRYCLVRSHQCSCL